MYMSLDYFQLLQEHIISGQLKSSFYIQAVEVHCRPCIWYIVLGFLHLQWELHAFA